MGKPWSEADDAYLREHAPTTPHVEIAAKLGRSVSSVKHRASRLGVRGRDKSVVTATRVAEAKAAGTYVPPESSRVYEGAWSDEELKFLADNYVEMTQSEIAEALGRTVFAVHTKRHDMGLRKGYQTGERHAAWKGGKKHHSSHWKRVIRPQVLERDGWSCQNPECGVVDFSGASLRAHHIVPFRFTQDDSLENHVTLCQPCHAKQAAHWWDDATEESIATLPPYQLSIFRPHVLEGSL